MRSRLLAILDPFVVALLTTVLLASLVPARGAAVPLFEYLTDAAIVLLFFLHGAKLSREAIWEGARAWRLHLAVFLTTFAIFPMLGVVFSHMPGLSGPVAAGILFLTLLPSTVQSSIAFTAIARGNVAAAVCSASFSNLIGVVLTPALAALLMVKSGTGGGISLGSIETIALQLLLPFVAGHLLRLLIGGFIGRHKQILNIVDRGSILLVVYTAFSAAVVEGLWHRVSAGTLVMILITCCLLLAAVLLISYSGGKLLGFSREDSIVLLFCGSKKSLASGVPIASVLFPVAQVGSVILPLMLFHQIQLIACAVIARRYAALAASESR
jgi:solute carrier family 10 (sodium/bile acid cotransporter), member 7